MGKTNKGKELGTGIYQRANGTYEARYIDRFGKQRSVYAKTITEVGKKQREKIFENEKQINVIDTKMTLDEWYEKWITVCKKHCRTTTKRTYEIQYNRLRESLGWRKLTSLNLIVLQDAFNELGSDKSRSDCKALLVDILNRAVEADLLIKNPALGINPIIDGKVKSEKRILSREEMEILLENSKGGMMYPIFVVALGTGMRIGDDDDKIRLNQRKPSKYKGLRRFGPEKNLQRINKFMKERPIFYKNLIQMKENIRFYLRCFYCITKVMILQFNSENRTELARNG